jgi:hypothetical protein
MLLRTPFFRSSKGTWYAYINGRQRSLGVKGNENEQAAYVAWHRTLANVSETLSATPTNALERHERRSVGVSLGELLERFLEDAKKRVGSETHRKYNCVLRPLIEREGKRQAANVDATVVQLWASNNPSWSQ